MKGVGEQAQGLLCTNTPLVLATATQRAGNRDQGPSSRLQENTFMCCLLLIPAPRAESGKALWVPGKKGPSEISGTRLEGAIIYHLEDVCGV